MKLAIVGAGVSGLVAAWLLKDRHEVTVFEADNRPGGHVHTHEIHLPDGEYAIDSGFIVYNEQTYPNLTRLFRRLGVATQESEMSFSVRCERTGLEFRPSSFGQLFAQKRNLLRPRFWRMLREIRRLSRELGDLRDVSDELTLSTYLHDHGYGDMFIRTFIMPMASAIWSAEPGRVGRMPLKTFARFFQNHGFLRVRGQPIWRTVRGGSIRYIEKLTAGWADRIHLGRAVRAVHRAERGLVIADKKGRNEAFDQAILAVHSNQALKMLAQPHRAERDVLGAIHYQENHADLHTDTSLLPRRRKCWASWNYHLPDQTIGRVAVTYDMNILQRLVASREFCVTLNRSKDIDSSAKLASMSYAHPQYDSSALRARRCWPNISGRDRVHFAGAYWGYGFHEDGVRSALAVAESLGGKL